MKSSNAIVAFPDAGVRRRDHELAFLPAALEIIETPPSPIGRAIGATIIAVFVLALAWACLGTVDIVATAQGKIIPSGRTKVIQPFEIGVVRAIHVHDGDNVKAGEVLIELDPTINAAEREHLQSDLIAAQLDVARLRAALADGPDPLADFHPPEGASADLIATQRQYLTTQTAEHRAKIAALDRQMQRQAAQVRGKFQVLSSEQGRRQKAPVQGRNHCWAHGDTRDLQSHLAPLLWARPRAWEELASPGLALSWNCVEIFLLRLFCITYYITPFEVAWPRRAVFRQRCVVFVSTVTLRNSA